MTFDKDKAGWIRIAKGWHRTLEELPKSHFARQTADETRRKHGERTPSIAILYHHIDGSPILRADGTQISRDRLADPLDGKNKYRARKHDGVHLWFPPDFLQWLTDHPKALIRLAEGEMKAEAVLGGVSFGGVSAWQSGGAPAPEFEELRPYLQGRRVEVIPDSDVPGNSESRKWIARLLKYVASLGPKSVEYVPLPTLSVNAANLRRSKTGLDDFLHEYDFAAFKALHRVPHDDPQFKQWDGEDDNGLPDALLSASPMPEDWLDPDKEPPPITWVVEDLIALNETTAVGGGAGAGKTTFVLNLMIGVVLGKDVLNFTIKEPRRVRYAMLERHERGLWRRVRKAVRCLFPKLTDEQRQTLKENFTPRALAGQQVRLIEHRQNQWTIHKANVDALIECMKEQRIEVLVFDTLSRLHGGNSNDDSLATALTSAFERITQATGAAVIILTHTGKNPQEGMYGGARGSSAWVDNTSNMIGLRLLDEDERSKVKVICDVKEAQDETLIVEMNHLRMSETTTMPTKHFAIKQGGDLDGWMWHVSIAKKHTPNEVINQKWFRDWHHTVKITEHAFVKKCMEGEGIGKRKAPRIFRELRKNGILEETGETHNNGTVYKLAAHYASTEAQPSAPRREKRRKKGK